MSFVPNSLTDARRAPEDSYFREDRRLLHKAAIGLVKAAIGSLLISFEFFSGNNHGFSESIGWNALTICVYALGFLLIYSAMKNCPFPVKPK
jgi:hypothetical protein